MNAMKRFALLGTALMSFLTGCGTQQEHTASSQPKAAASSGTMKEIATKREPANLQNWLLTKAKNAHGNDYDLNHDERWDAFDLCLMKRELLNRNIDFGSQEKDGFIVDMTLTMQSGLNVDMSGRGAPAGDYGAMMNGGSGGVVNNYYNNDNSRTVNQTNNSPKSLSRIEIYYQTWNGVTHHRVLPSYSPDRFHC